MEIDKIRKAFSKVLELEATEKKLKEILSYSSANVITVGNKGGHNYEVRISDLEEFTYSVRTLAISSLKRRILKLEAEINEY